MTDQRSAPQENLPEDFDLARLAEIPDPAAAGISNDASNAETVATAGEKVRARVLAEPPTATRSDVARRRMVALGVSLVWLVALLFVAGFQRDVAAGQGAFFGQVVAPAGLGFVALYVALARGRLGLGPRRTLLTAVTLTAPVLFGLAALASAATFSSGEPTMVKHAIGCCGVALIVATVPMIAAAYGLRRISVTGASWRSSLVGIGIGLVSAAVLGMHCSTTDGGHVLAGHVTPVLILGLSALVVVRRFARVD